MNALFVNESLLLGPKACNNWCVLFLGVSEFNGKYVTCPDSEPIFNWLIITIFMCKALFRHN